MRPVALRLAIPPPLVLLAVVAPQPALAADHDVGEGQTYATPAEVPWASLQPGDTVRIHARAEPYRERWGITVSGTADAPISIVGVPADDGTPPTIDGQDAIDGPDAHPRGLITIREGAQHLRVRCLELRGAHPEHGFPDAASGIYVESGRNLDFEALTIHGCGNGFFVAPDAADIRLADSIVFGNGNDGSIYEHNAYTESDGIVYEGNRFGPLREAALGTNIKDRSADTIIRYNWVEGGNRSLDLVEPEDGAPAFGAAAQTSPAFVYGNVFIKRDDAPTNSQVVHFGGDLGGGGERENLYFYANTVFSTRPTTTGFYLNAAAPHAVIVDNIFFTTQGGASLRMFDTDTSTATTGSFDHNWVIDGWVLSADPGLAFDGLAQTGTLGGADPGFASIVDEDLHLVADAAVRDAGVALPAELAAMPPTSEPTAPGLAPRIDDGLPDLGAFEYCEGECGGGDTSGGTDGGTDDGGADGSADEGPATGDGTVGSEASAGDGSAGDGAGGTADSSGAQGPGASDDGDADGCGCGATAPSATAWLLALVLLARRRRSGNSTREA